MANQMTQAEAVLLSYTDGKVDAVLDLHGRTYLLRPAQEKLRESEHRLQALIDSSPDVITVIDHGGVILSQSKAARRVLGYPLGAMVGRQLFDYVHRDDLANVHGALISVIEGLREDETIQFRHLAPDESYRLVEASVSSLRGQPEASIIFSLRRVNEALQGTQAAIREIDLLDAALAKDRFIAVLSHELRTPLTPALLAVNLLQEEECRLEVKATLEMIKRNLQMESDLIDELMNFVAVGHHKVRLHLEPVDVHAAILSAVEICKADLKAAQIDLLFDLRATHHGVKADPLRLQQVLWNLLKNAVKFSPPLSSISISTSNDEVGYIAIEIRDHGIGIPTDLLPLVFDPFRQGLLTNGNATGLGLGLFIAKGLVEAHDATLTVASEGSGLGSVFRLVFRTTAQPGDPLVPIPWCDQTQQLA